MRCRWQEKSKTLSSALRSNNKLNGSVPQTLRRDFNQVGHCGCIAPGNNGSSTLSILVRCCRGAMRNHLQENGTDMNKRLIHMAVDRDINLCMIMLLATLLYSCNSSTVGCGCHSNNAKTQFRVLFHKSLKSKFEFEIYWHLQGVWVDHF